MDTQPTPPTDATPEVPRTVKQLSGHDDGEKLLDGTTVKGDYDANGNVIGWHKEPATEVTI